jgi:DNA-binding transcriptional LysR family regulator
MKQLSLDILRTLVTIVDVGNFNKAGELLGRSQPAISLQIKKLEGQINRKLFNKVGQSYQINNDGKWLYAKAKQMLAINDEVFRELSHETLRGRLRLGIPSEFASVLLPSIIGEFSKRYPDVSLDVTSLLSKHLLSSDQSGQFDLILALIPEASDAKTA